MSVRFNADENYTRALSLGSQSNYTFCLWGRLAADRNTYSAFCDVNNGTESLILQCDLDGTSLIVYDDASGGVVANGVSLTVGTWYFMAVAVAGTSATLYWRAANTQTFSTDTWTGATRMLTNLIVGDDNYNEWLNGNICAFKLWTAGLSAAEVAQESQQYLPQRTAGLQVFCPFIVAETTDYSGNGRTLSGGVGTTTEDGPPIPWQLTPPRLILPPAASGTTGSADAPLGALTATASGTPTVTGTAAAPLGSLAATAAGGGTISGAAAAAFGTMSATATGLVTILAAAAAPVGALTAAATGAVTVTATAEAGFGTLTASASGTTSIAGVAAAALGGLTATASGTVTPVGGGSATATLGQLAATIAATVQVAGSAVAALGALTASATGTRTSTATVAAVLGGLVAAASGVRFTTGTAVALLGALIAAGVVQPPVTRGGSALLDRTAAAATSTSRGAATATLLERTAPSARGGA